MKTYVITLAKTFPAGHPNAGDKTYFRERFENRYKIHTIRGNVLLWQKRMNEVEAGEACLSIREWSGRPYNSKQVEIARLTKENGVGMQVMQVNQILRQINVDDDIIPFDPHDIATNDGLSLQDWSDWFNLEHVQDGTRFAIIHFTPFRY